MKICEQYALLLDSFVDGELPDQEAGRVRDHLSACPACAAYVSDAFAIRAAFEDVEETEVPAGFADGVMAVIRANAAPRKKPHRALKTIASLAACAALVFATVRMLPFERFSGSMPMAGGGAAFKVESETSAPESQESLPTQEEGKSEDAPFGEDTMSQNYRSPSSQRSEIYDASSADSPTHSAQQPPPSLLMTHQASESDGASKEDIVFAGVVFLPASERLTGLLEGRESTPYSGKDGGSGTGYAMTLEELTAILEELGVEAELRLNTDKTTELYCLVVSDS